MVFEAFFTLLFEHGNTVENIKTDWLTDGGELKIYGRGGHLGHVTRTIWTNFRSHILRSLHMKFEFDWPSGFRDVWNCGRTTDAGVTGILLAHPWAFGSGELKKTCQNVNLIRIFIKFWDIFFHLCGKYAFYERTNLKTDYNTCSSPWAFGKGIQNIAAWKELTLKAPITTAADDKFCHIFPFFFDKNEVGYFMRIVCQQTILMKYHDLFVIFEKAAKLEIVVCCKL